MKNKAGFFTGFIVGFAGFATLYKVFVLSRIPPSDEIAPGMVLIAAVLSGALFAFAGKTIQARLRVKNKAV